MISGMNSENREFLCTKKCPCKEFMSKFIYEFMENHEFIYEFMENHEFIYEFMKKTYDLGCTKKCPVKEFLQLNSYKNSYI